MTCLVLVYNLSGKSSLFTGLMINVCLSELDPGKIDASIHAVICEVHTPKYAAKNFCGRMSHRLRGVASLSSMNTISLT